MTHVPIRVYAYERPRGRLNFGDDMSVALLGHLIGRPTVRSSWKEAQVIGIGSVLHHVLRLKAAIHHMKSLGKPRPLVLGAGLIGPQSVLFRHHLRFLSVRGPHTAENLRLRSMVFGDPGILACEVIDSIPPKHDLGVVPHYTEAGSPALHAFLKAFPRAHLIDVEQDWRVVLQEISACRAIVSSSLHGLIVADSYAIPNKRVTFSPENPLSDFKFRDYADGINRPDHCALADTTSAVHSVMQEPFEYGDAMADARRGLRRVAKTIPGLI